MYYSDNNDKIQTPIVIKLILLLAGLVIGFFILRIFIISYKISDNSMNPNLEKNDILFAYKNFSPKKGDIVIFESPLQPGKIMTKRIIATSGEYIEIKNKVFHINNTPQRFSWPTKYSDKRIFNKNFSNRDNLKMTKIKQDYFFVIGDNLDQSFDSREFGPINSNSIIGIVFLKI